MKIVVLGGSGFIGSHVADELSKRGHKITIFDIKKSKWLRNDQKMHVGNILNSRDLEKIIKNAEVVFHFAGLADLTRSLKEPINTVRLNILGTVQVLELCRKYKIKRLVHASTIYVNSIEGGFYRISKKAAEDYVEEYNKTYGLNYTILRFGSIYGLRSGKTNGLRSIIQDSLNNNLISYGGSRKTARRYIHVLDVAKACADILKNKYKNQHIIITGKKNIKITKFLKNLSKILNISGKINFKNKKDTGHYEATPYTYKFKKGKNYKLKSEINIYTGILELIKEIKSTIKYF